MGTHFLHDSFISNYLHSAFFQVKDKDNKIRILENDMNHLKEQNGKQKEEVGSSDIFHVNHYVNAFLPFYILSEQVIVSLVLIDQASMSSLGVKYQLRLRLRFTAYGTDPLCLHGTDSKLEWYGSILDVKQVKQPIRFNFDVEYCRLVLPRNQILCLHHFNSRSLYLQS